MKSVADLRYSCLVWPLLVAVAGFSLPVGAASNSDALDGLLGNIVACNLSERLMADIQPAPLYQAIDGSCSAVTDDVASLQTLYSDPACGQALAFQTTPLVNYCLRTLNKEQLGNADDLQGQAPFWTLSPGNRFDLGALSLEGLAQPYMSRVAYKQVETEGGTCNLEMRIYKSSPTATGLNSMLALHGGSWTSRGFGFLGLEMTVPHFTNAGFVVFAPFYRLLENREGNAACHNASIQDVIEDAADAMEFIIANAQIWGGSERPAVFGQSAGAHLAASIAVTQPQRVSNAVLLYPPTDFSDFVSEILNGNYTNEEGLNILQRVIGGEAAEVDVSASPIPENSFPAIVQDNPAAYPPMFMLHGLADDLVDARQSLRLCAALGGDVAASQDADVLRQRPELRHILDCDTRQSKAHLIKEGKHALDVCPLANPLLSSACLSGSEQSKALVADSMSQAVSWSESLMTVADNGEVTTPPATVPDSSTGGSSGGGASGVLLLWVLLCRCLGRFYLGRFHLGRFCPLR